MQRLILASVLALATATAAAPAQAEIVTVRYNLRSVANYAGVYGWFGGADGPVSGRIIGTTLVIDYTAADGLDAADFHFVFEIPVTDLDEPYIALSGADLGWSGEGQFDYSLENSDAYNGPIREGSFSSELTGGGELTDSYVEFLVETEPTDSVFQDGFDPAA